MAKLGMRFGVTRYGAGIAGQVAFARLAEELGFDLIGYGDTQNLIPDCYVVMTAMALATRRVRIGQTVSNPLTRHPAVTASAMSALQEVSGGRAFLGIGTGDSALANIGERPATLAELEAYCQAVRGLCAGQEVLWRGRTTRLFFEPRRVPIWIAAEGPRTQHLAGRIADGVIFANGISEPVVKDNLRRVREGALAAGRDPDSIECWFLVKPCFAGSERQAWHDCAWTLSASANHAFRFGFEGKHVPEEHRAGLKRLMQSYASSQHNVRGSGDHNARIVIENDLTEFLGRRFLLAGSAPRIAERLLELASWGATNLILALLFADADEYAQRLAREVLAPLRSARGSDG
jgi:5,10-methylenetetrahydromethanopterin reductase